MAGFFPANAALFHAAERHRIARTVIAVDVHLAGLDIACVIRDAGSTGSPAVQHQQRVATSLFADMDPAGAEIDHPAIQVLYCAIAQDSLASAGSGIWTSGRRKLNSSGLI